LQEGECSGKEGEYEEKKGQVPGTSKKRKNKTRGKNDKCPTVELGVQDTHLREKKKEI